MNITDEKLHELMEKIASDYKMKGSISTNSLYDALEKYDLSPPLKAAKAKKAGRHSAARQFLFI